MRYVGPTRIESVLPSGWLDRASAAKEDVKDLDPASCARCIDNKPLWGGVRRRFGAILQRKCWYCESAIKRSHMPIDHFRPKNSVAECAGHRGYWWLAYDWRNYRFCCTYCNSHGTAEARGTAGGKHDHFPLWDENVRAMEPEDDIEREQPLLLDPCDANDPRLLWFDPDGTAVPNPSHCLNDPEAYPTKRATTSIKLYHLNEPDLRERRGLSCKDVREACEAADALLEDVNAGESQAETSYRRELVQLCGRVGDCAEYSAAVKATLRALIGTSPTADTVLQMC